MFELWYSFLLSYLSIINIEFSRSEWSIARLPIVKFDSSVSINPPPISVNQTMDIDYLFHTSASMKHTTYVQWLTDINDYLIKYLHNLAK